LSSNEKVKCSKCGELKERSKFGISKRSKNGLQTRCKECRHKIYKERKLDTEKWNEHQNRQKKLRRERHKKQKLEEPVKHRERLDKSNSYRKERGKDPIYIEKRHKRAKERRSNFNDVERSKILLKQKIYREARNGDLLRQLRQLWSSAKSRAKKRNMEFSITKEDLFDLYKNQKGSSTISGLKMSLINNTKNKMSLDRVDSSLGYNKNNIQLLCKWENSLKSNYPEKDLLLFAKGLIKKYESN